MIGEQLSHYSILGNIGSGGMGEVYLARDELLDRNVALKLLPARVTADAGQLSRFAPEAKILASLNHPNIVTIHSVEEFEGRHFLAMELVDGQQMDVLIPEGGFALDEFLSMALPLTEAVSAAHGKGIVHRDLKPANIMVTKDRRVKVLDFGLAELRKEVPTPSPDHDTQELLEKKAVVGTVSYMAPEQLSGRGADARSDVFSLGVIFYEMASGRHPFDRESAGEAIASILRDDPPPLMALNAGIPRHLANLVDQCLEKDPQLRPASAAELRDDLERIRTAKDLLSRGSQSSIAVLPFVDMSPERDQEYFCEGMAEQLINVLTQLDEIQVASRTSAFLYKDKQSDLREIGRKLNVAHVLEGSVRKSGDTLRITAQLIDVADGYHLWSKQYDRTLEDVFAIQDEISSSIVRALQITLSSGEEFGMQSAQTNDVLAYDYYLRGRKLFFEQRTRSIEMALQMYALAIEHDPEYSLAYAGIANCHSYLYQIHQPSQEHLDLAEQASRRALGLKPELAEAHTARGFALSVAKRHAEAEHAFSTAIRLNPRLFDAYYLFARDAFARGAFEQSAALFEQAIEVCPEDFQAPLMAAQSYTSIGRDAEATAARRQGVRIAERVLEANPGNVRALYLGANGLSALGEREKALEWAALAVSMDPNESMVLYNVACIYAKEGEIGRSLDFLERAIKAGLTLKGWIVHDSDLDPIRSHPRYLEILGLLGDDQ
jgi:serine/threonine protein kinase